MQVLSNLFTSLKNIDEQLFLFFNTKHNDISDFVALLFSSKLAWIPFYLWLLWKLYNVYKTKIYIALVSVFFLILSSDQLSKLIKNTVKRFRPCHNEKLQNVVHIVNNDCGGMFGFVSSHAANSAALATYLILVFGVKNRVLTYTMLAYSILVSYSRIMLGRHYPLDLIGGWCVGITCGLLIYKIQQKLISDIK